MAELSIEIAGLRTAIVMHDLDVAAVVHERFRDFLSPGTPVWRIEIGLLPGSLPFSEGVMVRLDGSPDRFSVKRHDFAGTVDLDERTADVVLTDPDNVSSEVSIESFLRILYS